MILFLDFDGVLHPDAAYLVNGRPTLRAEGELFMWAPLLVDVLSGFPETEIVLSTSWARELSFTRARRWLPPALRRRVIGATWHTRMSLLHDGLRSVATWWDGATRYEQIKRYASRAGRSDWLAIDDQPEGWAAEDLEKLVHTDGQRGLSDPRALALLAERLSKSILDENKWRQQVIRRVMEARSAILWQRQQIELDDLLRSRQEEDAYLLRIYLQLMEVEEECARMLSRQQGKEEFMMLVRAAAAARDVMEKLAQERKKNAGFLKGIADAIEMRNARERAWSDYSSGPGVP